MSQSTHASQGYYLAQPVWYLVRQFAGIYGVKMNYKAVKKLNRDVISRAYFDVAKLPAILS
jgi:C4-dicarboxylate-specific signal transduction histidine kinase